MPVQGNDILSPQLAPEATAERVDLGFCGSCIGACCMAGSTMELSRKEAAYMESRGTELKHVQNPYGVKQKKELYELQTDCANLDPATRACTDYDKRPGICRDFKAGSALCKDMRQGMQQRIDQGIVDLPMPTLRIRHEEKFVEPPEPVRSNRLLDGISRKLFG